MAEVSNAGDLGPVVATKKHSTVGGILFTTLGAVFGAPSVLAFRDAPLLAVAGILTMAVPMMALGIWTATRRYQIRSRGLSSHSAFGARSIAFSSIRTFEYWCVVQRFRKGVGLMLHPFTGKRFGIGVGIPLRAAEDRELGALRDKLSLLISRRLQDDLQREGAAVWIERGRYGLVSYPTLKITRDGFALDDGRSILNVLPTEVALQIEDGRFSMVRMSDNKRLVFCPVATANFFPGLTLLARLRPESVATKSFSLSIAAVSVRWGP
jgi:hypothetical protein